MPNQLPPDRAAVDDTGQTLRSARHVGPCRSSSGFRAQHLSNLMPTLDLQIPFCRSAVCLTDRELSNHTALQTGGRGQRRKASVPI